MKQSNYHKVLFKLMLSVVAVFVGTMSIFVAPVNALNNTGPDERDFTTSKNNPPSAPRRRNMRFLLNKGSVNATESVFVIYSRSRDVKMTIYSPGLYNDRPQFGDYYSAGHETIFTLESYNETPSVTYKTKRVGKTPKDISFGGKLHETSSITIGKTKWYRALVRAKMVGEGGSAGNSFDVIAANDSIISYYHKSGAKFVVQDRGENFSLGRYNGPRNNRHTDFHLKFGTECNATGKDLEATISWYDDDLKWELKNGDPTSSGIQAGVKNFHLEVIEKNRDGKITNKYFLKKDYYDLKGHNHTGKEYSNFSKTSGWTGNKAYGWAKFTAKPDHTYEAIFYEVMSYNAIQFQLPYDSIYYDHACTINYEPSLRREGSGDVHIGDTIKLIHTTKNTASTTGPEYARRVHVQYPDGTIMGSGKLVTRKTNWGGEPDSLEPIMTRQYGAPSIAGEKTSDKVTTYRADKVGRVCFVPSIGVNNIKRKEGNKVCVNIKKRPVWRYDARTLGGTTQTKTVYPRDRVTYITDVKNTGGGNGIGYNHALTMSGDMQILNPDGKKETDWRSNTGIQPGKVASRHSTSWTIDSDAPHGKKVKINTFVTPVAGETGGGTTNSGKDWGSERTYTVYNMRFNLSATVPADTVAEPGEVVTVNYKVCNTESIPRGSTRGVAPKVSISITGGIGSNSGWTSEDIKGGANSCWTHSRKFKVPDNARVGSTYTTTLTTDKDRGYSNNYALVGRNSETFRIIVGVKPYLHVLNGDVWAGANFDNATHKSCNSSTNADRKIESVIRGKTGSFVQYAAYATGKIDGFGTDGRPDWKKLTFANTDPNGHYADPKCIPDYFGVLGQKGAYDGDVRESNSANLNAIAQSGKQIKVHPSSGTFKIVGNNDAYSKNSTLVVDGNVYIAKDIKYATNYGSADNLHIPSLIIVAKGDIFIDEGVKQVDAILISHGTIWTCANGAGGISKVSSKVCVNPLTINGAVIANKINFMRTHGENGGVNNVNSEPSEVINFSPEFFLSRPVLKTPNGSDLRSVLLKDLPPVY